ncbi:LysM peptidoglycan-binding domain-containing protein [bacterium]|nr:LysM peptidoglycan-binding domain-containing protein [bacterium]
MKNLSVNRSSLSGENISILSKLVFGNGREESVQRKTMEYNNYNNNTNQESKDIKVHDNALGVLYKSLHDTKTQRKPLVYFFVGLVIGVLATLFLSAVVLVSDKDTIQSDVKTVKETISEVESSAVENNTKSVSEAVTETAPEVLTVGEVSEDENGQKIYTVKEGDTLGGIVNRLYGDSSTYNPDKVEKFKEVNGLKSIHMLKIGQKLIIPD